MAAHAIKVLLIHAYPEIAITALSISRATRDGMICRPPGLTTAASATTARSAAKHVLPSSVDQRHQEDAQIGDGNGENIRCGCHPVAAKEGAPLSGPCLRIFNGQNNRNIGRKHCSASFEGPLNGLDKGGPAA